MMLGYYGSGFAGIASIYGEQRFSGNEQPKDELAKRRQKKLKQTVHPGQTVIAAFNVSRSPKTAYLQKLLEDKEALELALFLAQEEYRTTIKRAHKEQVCKQIRAIQNRLLEIEHFMSSSS